MKTVKISLYTIAGEVSGSSYYRLFQYFDNSGHRIRKRIKLTSRQYSKWMPLSKKPLYFKAFVFIYMYLRRFFDLLSDCIDAPDVLILSRGLITRVTPPSYRLMLNHMASRGTRIIWDYDDNIIDTREITRKHFDWLSSLASHIVVAGQANIEMLREEFRHKAIVLPTTDRDMYRMFGNDLILQRLDTLRNEVRLIWVGTAVSLPYVKGICHAIENFASGLGDKKKVSLTVVCNHPLEYNPTYFRLNNIKWTRAVAIEEMKKAHFGIMPLSDKLFNRYKGGFKLIQYLSIGLPVVGSAIGVNNEIIQPGFGFKTRALECDQWLEALNQLPTTAREYAETSIKAFGQWAENYSYETNRRKWNELVTDVLR